MACPEGTLLVREIQPDDLGAASVVLTRSFATSPQGVPIEEGRRYCEEALAFGAVQPPKGVLLVGLLAAAGAPPGAAPRLVATAAVSFCRDSREEFPSLQPPDGAAYVSNMAVDPAFRRRGHARRMLAAAEAAAAARGFADAFLHARLGDEPALALYASAGYEHVDEDSWLVKLRGRTPRRLMRKRLDGSGAAGRGGRLGGVEAGEGDPV